MIGEVLIDLFFGIFSSLFSVLEFVHLPTDTIGTLVSIMAYGNWVVGVDIMALFAGSVIFWWGVHMSIGLAVWLWEKLPLT